MKGSMTAPHSETRLYREESGRDDQAADSEFKKQRRRLQNRRNQRTRSKYNTSEVYSV